MQVWLVTLLPYVPHLLALALPILFGWLGNQHFKNANIEKAKQFALDAASNVAKAVAQPYVDELAKDAADGVITPEEQSAADSHAVTNMIKLIPPVYLTVLQVLFPGTTLGDYLMGVLKGVAHDITIARQAAYASVPGLTNEKK